MQKTKKLKKINCHPSTKNKTISKTSCLNVQTLNKLKDSFNQKYPDNKIKSKDKKGIFNELQNKLKDCKREDCWLDVIKDKKEKKEIKNKLYAPEQPEEWKQDPSSWLSNYDILDVLSQYEETYSNFKFIGPTPIDFDSKPNFFDEKCVWKELCNFQLQNYIKKGINKIGVVFNLDEHDEPGSHWTSLFIDLEDKIIFYFDSAGDKVPNEVDKLVKRIIHQGLYLSTPIQLQFHENHPFVHQKGNNECGMYSLYFIITMLTSRDGNEKKLKSMEEKLNYFKNKRIPDKYVFQKRDVYFNK